MITFGTINGIGPAIVGGVGILIGVFIAPLVWRDDKKALLLFRIYCVFVFIAYMIVWAVQNICNLN